MRYLRACCVLAVLAVASGTAAAATEPVTSEDARTAVVGDEPDDAALELEFADDFDDVQLSFPDPLERLNRGTLAFNRVLDRWLLNPITEVYQFVLPNPVRKSVRNFFTNLDSPAILANDLLQREWSDARVTVIRFSINTTVGIAGFFDPATPWGFEGHYSDFGQTMALEGVPSGAYLVVPLLGPTTVRDGTGKIVDVLFRPVTFILGPVEQIFYTTIYGGGTGLIARDAHASELAMLEQSSIDFYAALRNAYYQSRTAEIWARRSDHESLSEWATEYNVWNDSAKPDRDRAGVN